MPEVDNYKEFDNASIISRDTVSIGKITVRKRELIFGGIAVLALIGVIILAIVLAVEVSNCQSLSNDLSNDLSNYCNTVQCLKAAHYEKSIMNESADPCTNFYQFACGGYSTVYPQNPLIPDQTPFDQIHSENLQKLIYAIQFPPVRKEEDSYERKLRHFITSCNNHYDKMELRGQPFLEKVLKRAGGWNLFGTWNASSFNLQDDLKKVHGDFWTSALFTLFLSTDTYNWNKKIIEINYGGISLNDLAYTYPQYFQNEITFYTNLMSTLARLLARDAQVNVTDSQINEFINDTMEVETAIATAINNSNKQIDPHADQNRISLATLNQLTSGSIDFVDYFSYTFTEGVTFSENTLVAVLREGFFHDLGPRLNKFESTVEGKRKLHNYMVWRLILRYSSFLSWDYVHALRQFNNVVNYKKDSSSGFGDCFRQAESSMFEAMGALFIKEYVNLFDKQEASYMLTNIRELLVKKLENVNWMSNDNKQHAIKKIQESIYKIGSPDFMVDDNYMDSLYAGFPITDNDYFGNVLSLNGVRRKEFTSLLAKEDAKTMWAYPVMLPVAEYYNPWHEFIMTGGMLQSPLFAYNSPKYYNFGGIGTIMAMHLMHAFDEYGSQVKLDQSNPGNWWTNFTVQHYLDIKKCAIQSQKDFKLGPYNITSSKQHPGDKNQLSISLAPELLAETSGLKLSLEAYTEEMSKKGVEKVPVAFTNYSPEQLFFIAYAQAKCQNVYDGTKLSNLVNNKDMPGEYRVNIAVSQVPQFSNAFKCRNDAPMRSEKQCSLF